jgi:16S rRNA processing protein RimM
LAREALSKRGVSAALVPIARLSGVFGVRGELKCDPTAAGESALLAGTEYALGVEPGARRVRVTTLRRHKLRFVVTLEGVATVEAAQAFVGAELYAERSALRLAPGEYLDVDLIGLQLIGESGVPLGEVVGIEHLPAHDCLVVGPARALVPMVKAFVREIDLGRRTIAVGDLPEGLL